MASGNKIQLCNARPDLKALLLPGSEDSGLATQLSEPRFIFTSVIIFPVRTMSSAGGLARQGLQSTL